MRKINARFFLGLVATVAVLTGAIVLVHRLQANNIAGAFLFQANQAEKQGRLDQAARYLGRYLEFVPNNVEERARLGSLLADPSLATSPRARNRARFVIEQVLIRDPQQHALRQTLCRLMLDGQQWENVREHIQYLEKALPESGAVALLSGEWHEGKDQTNEAVNAYRRALRLTPEKGEAYVRLVNLLVRLDRKRGAYAKEIDELVTTALAKDPNNSSVLVLAAEHAREKGDDAAARNYLEKAIREQPKDGRVYQALARLENQLGERDKAIAVLRNGAKSAGKEQRFDLLWSLANLYLDGGDLAETRKVMAEIREAHTAPTALEYLEARCRMVQGRWYEASRLFEKIRISLKSVPELSIQADLFLGTCYEQLEDPAQQMAAFKRVLEQDPFSADARKGLASALWQLGQPGEAIAQYEQMAEQSGKAKERGHGKTELARVLLLDTLQREVREWSRVERVIDEAEKEQPGAAEIALLRAEVAFARGKAARADEILAEALKRHPNHVELWATRASMAARNGKLDDAQNFLNTAALNNGQSLELRLATAQFWVDRAASNSAAEIIKLADDLDKLKADDQVKLRYALAESLQQLSAYTDAEAMLQPIRKLARHAEDVRLRLFLFDLALARGDEPAMQNAISELQSIEGQEGAMWRYCEAQRLIRLGREGRGEALDKARGLLTAVAAQRPDWHGVALLRAEIDEMQGKSEQAISNYRRALDLGNRSAGATRQLVLLLLRNQRFDEAEQELRKLQSQAPLSGELQRLAVAISLNKQDFQKAEIVARQSLSAGSTDYRDYLWAAQVLAARGSASVDAEKAFRRAIGLEPKAPEGWVALVRYLAGTGQTEAARTEVEKARGQIDPERLDLALAQCFDVLGQGDQVPPHLAAALKKQPSSAPVRRLAADFFLRSGQPNEAEAALRPIVAKNLNVPDEEMAASKRLLALTLASTGDPRRQREALELVGVAIEGNGKLVEESTSNLDDQRCRAKVLALQTRRACRERAIQLLEGLHERQALSADDQFLLVQLFLRQGPEEVWDRKARDLLGSLTRAYPNEPRFLAFFANRLLAKNEIDRADTLIARLEQVEKIRHVPPGALGSIELKARALEKRGKTDAALALLTSFAGENNAPAERMFAVAQLQGRLGNLKEAIDLCARAAATLPPETAYNAAVAILRAHRGNDRPGDGWTQQWTRLEKMIRDTIATRESNLAFYLLLADLLDMKGDLRELETVCRKVLERDPDNMVTLNNLAWHLGPHTERATEALGLINRAIDKHGQRPELLDTRAFIYLNMNEGEKALADLTEAVKENPTAIRYFHLTRAHHLTHNRGQAVAALRQANALGLSVQRLHPAEREVYARLAAELKQN